MEGDADTPDEVRFEKSRRLDNLHSDCGGTKRRPNIILVSYRPMAYYCGDIMISATNRGAIKHYKKRE